MKKSISVITNKLFSEEIELLYGKGSYVKINNVTYSTNKKNYLIDCVLFVSDIELYGETQNDGIKYIIENSWDYTGLNEYKPMLLISIEIIPDKPL